MKTTIILFAASIASAMSAFANPAYEIKGDVVNLTAPRDNHNSNQPRRSPILIPIVSIDDHTLYCYDEVETTIVLYTLNENDEEEDEVYEVTVESGLCGVELPANLQGEYGIEIIRNGKCFTGVIELY